LRFCALNHSNQRNPKNHSSDITPPLLSSPFHFLHIPFLSPQTLLSKLLATTFLHIRGFAVTGILIGLAAAVIAVLWLLCVVVRQVVEEEIKFGKTSQPRRGETLVDVIDLPYPSSPVRASLW